MNEYYHDAEAQEANEKGLALEAQGLENLESIFSGSIVTIEEKKEMALKKYITCDLIKEGAISTVYGNAGAGKTSLILYYAMEWIEKHNKQVLYINMDGDNPMTIPLQELYGSKFLDIGKSTPVKIMPRLLAINEATLSQTVLIFDTYKKFTADVNSKGANTALFEKLRELQGKGATVILLAHTNKDKGAISGTADIEQDGDCMLRVSGMKADRTLTVSIKEGGRTRWQVIAKTYDIIIKDYPDLEQVTERSTYTDIQPLEDEKEDLEYIEAIKEIIDGLGYPNTKKLREAIAGDTLLTRTQTDRILEAYLGKHWQRSKVSSKHEFKWALMV